MTVDSKIARLIDSLEPGVRAAIGPLLRTLVHDLNGRLSTLLMESSSLESAVEHQEFADVTDIAQNISAVTQSVTQYVRAIEVKAETIANVDR